MKFLFLLVGVFLLNNVLAVNGVSPGSFEVDFEPGLESEFVFNFVLSGEEKLSVEGDLRDFVSLDSDKVSGNDKVTVSLKLPNKLEKVGANEIWIIAGDVRGLIRVNVPYPDKFVKLDFSAPNVNLGENVLLSLKVLNFGKEYIFANVSFEIYRLINGERGNLIEDFYIGGKWINVSGESDFVYVLNSSDYLAGDYLAVARVLCDSDIVESENVFRLGKVDVRVLNHSNDFYSNKINRFEIEVENLLNDKMKGVYFEARVIGTDVVFDSDIVNLDPWEKKTLVGFFDASDIKDDVEVDVNLYYSDNFSNYTVNLNCLRGFDWVLVFEVLMIFFFVGFLVWRIYMNFNK